MFKFRLVLYLLCSEIVIQTHQQIPSFNSSLLSSIGRAGLKRVPIQPIPKPVLTASKDVRSGGGNYHGTFDNDDIPSQTDPTTTRPTGNTQATGAPEPATSAPNQPIKHTEDTAGQPLSGITSGNTKEKPATRTRVRSRPRQRINIAEEFERIEQKKNPNRRIKLGERIYDGILSKEIKKEIDEIDSKMTPMSGHVTPEKEENLNRFENNNYLMVTASHGIYFYDYGDALIFHDQFDHFILFTIPSTTTIQKEFTEKDCIKFISDNIPNSYPNSSTPAGQVVACDPRFPIDECLPTLVGRFARICDRLVHFHDKQFEEFKDIIDSAYNAFENRLHNRNKRFVIPLVAAAVGYVAHSYFTDTCLFCRDGSGKHDSKKLWNSIRGLEAQMNDTQEGIKVMKELMSGLSKSVTNMEKSLRNEIKVLKSTMRFQIQNVEAAIKDVAIALQDEIRLEQMVKAMEDYINIRLSSLRNIMNLELRQMNKWENAFKVIQKGNLPNELLGYNQLKEILNEIKDQLNPNFDFAIDDSNFPLYYNLPIVDHALYKENDNFLLYIYLRIPLKQIRVNNRFIIKTINSYSFPCAKDQCILDEGRQSPGTLQQFDLPQMSLLVNPKDFKIQHEINLDYLDCQDQGKQKICYTYHPTMLHSPSSCTQAIFNWNETEIVNWCRFKPSKRETYKVIPMDYNYYLVHRDVVPFYNQYCNDTEDKILIGHWAEIFEIDRLCEVYISTTGQRLLGPFSDVLNGTSTNIKNAFLESKLISKIKEKYTNMTKFRLPFNETHRFIRSIEKRFRDNENSSELLDAQLSKEELSQMALFNMEVQEKLGQSVKQLSSKFTTYDMSGSFWGIIGLIGSGIQMMTTLTILFGTLSYSNAFGLIGATIVVIPPRAVTAWNIQLIPDIKVLPDITVDVLDELTGIAFFMSIAFVMLFVILLVFFLVFGTFRTIRFSQHWGVGPPLRLDGGRIEDNFPYVLMLHLNYFAHFVRYIKSRVSILKWISVTYSITELRK